MLERLKCLDTASIEGELTILIDKPSKGWGNITIVLDKPLVEVIEAKKGLDSIDCI